MDTGMVRYFASGKKNKGEVVLNIFATDADKI